MWHEIDQTWRAPGAGYEPIRNALKNYTPNHELLAIRVDPPLGTNWGLKPIAGDAGWHGRVIKQGRSRSRQDVLFDRLMDNPLIQVYYKNGNVSLKVDKVRTKALLDTVRLHVEDPKLVVEKVKNKVADKYAERRYLRDMALFV